MLNKYELFVSKLNNKIYGVFLPCVRCLINSVYLSCDIYSFSKYIFNLSIVTVWDWTNKLKRNIHYHCKQIIPNIQFAKDLFDKILVRLKQNELKIITRLISGHTQLRYYMYSIKLREDGICSQCYYDPKDKRNIPWYEQLGIFLSNNPNKKKQPNKLIKYEETIEHYLLYCSKYKEERIKLKTNINKIIQTKLNIQLLLTGYPVKDYNKRLEIIKHTISFIKETKRFKFN